MSISEIRRKLKKLSFVDLESIYQKLEEAFEVRFVDPTKLHYSRHELNYTGQLWFSTQHPNQPQKVRPPASTGRSRASPG